MAHTSKRLNPGRTGVRDPVFVNSEDRITVQQADPSGEREKPKEAIHKVHNCVEAPNACGGEGNFEESFNEIVFEPSARVAVASWRGQRNATLSRMCVQQERAGRYRNNEQMASKGQIVWCNKSDSERVVSVSVADTDGGEPHRCEPRGDCIDKKQNDKMQRLPTPLSEERSEHDRARVGFGKPLSSACANRDSADSPTSGRGRFARRVNQIEVVADTLDALALTLSSLSTASVT